MTDIAFTPFFASGALRFAFEKATTEGKTCIVALIILSIFSWTVIITKGRQLYRARKAGKKFFKAYRETRDPLELARRGEEFDGAPAYELYYTGAEEVELKTERHICCCNRLHIYTMLLLLLLQSQSQIYLNEYEQRVFWSCLRLSMS